MHQAGGTPHHRAPPHGAGHTRTARARHASLHGDGFGRFAAVTSLALLPGAGLVAAGRRRVGAVLLGLLALTVVAGVAMVLSGDLTGRALRTAVRPRSLMLIAGVIAVVALVWCLTIVATAWFARPTWASSTQRVLAVAFVAALCVAVAAPSSIGVRYALIQRDLVTSLFPTGDQGNPVAGAATPDTAQSNPWAGTPRVNVLLLGSDAGADRSGVRTDSMMVASINTDTGDTVLFGLPRNLQRVPFPERDPLHQVWPNGFDCGDVCLLNAVWEQAAGQHPDLFPGDKNPGLTAIRDVISEILGLRIDTYTTIDLSGFRSLVDAMGGVDVKVPRRIPIGGGHNQRTGAALPISGYIESGQQHLDGYQALWFSRSREGSDDYDRMRRQRCMTSSLLSQANPAVLLRKYPQLASVAKDNIKTAVRQQDLEAWVTLVQRIQKGRISSLPFTNEVISTVHPDFAQIRTLVRKAINPPAPKAKPSTSATPTPTPTPSTTPSATPTPSETDVTTAQDFTSVC